VCANERDPASPLGPGCGARGAAVYDALKDAVAARGAHRDVWITRTHCLGICPRAGATCATYDASGERRVLSEVEPPDAADLLDRATARASIDSSELLRLLDDLEALQASKVIDLARRLRPGLTDEDIRNPHDFPELADPDWHYADGILTGIQSVRSALAAIALSGERG
jgi:predicted metal-binding protein